MIRYPHFQANLLRAIILSLLLSACANRPATATPGAAPTVANFQQVTLIPTTALPSNTPTNTLVLVTETASPTFTASASPTPSCGAPAGWVSYTIRAGDNLFRLGLKTGVTVEEIKFANCLIGEGINTGDQLYLPFIPPVDTPVPPTAIPPNPCPSALSCPTPGLPALVLQPGGPNEGTFTPCNAASDEPWIDTRSPFGTELGTRRFFFACHFPANPTSASMKLSDGSTVPLNLLSSLPNPDLIYGSAQGAVEWVALPTHPVGTYTLTFMYTDLDGSQKPEDFSFNVEAPTEKHILVNPIAGSAGTTFQVYLVCFDLAPVLFGLYGEDQPTIGANHTLSYRGSWSVTITQPFSSGNCPGWVQTSLATSSMDRRAAYSITYGNQNNVFSLFWLR